MKIDKDIPVPEKTSRGRKSKYPWAEMEAGDSFFLESDKKFAPSAPQSVRDKGWTFTSRAVDGGFRIWRTE